MIKAIDEINRLKTRLNIVAKDLETLEDGVDADYVETVTKLREVVHYMEHRREVLQRRGRHV